jgi:hypothetical protein
VAEKKREYTADVGSIEAPQYPGLEEYFVNPVQKLSKNPVGQFIAPTALAEYLQKLNYGDRTSLKDKGLAGLDLATAGIAGAAAKPIKAVTKRAAKKLAYEEAPAIRNRLYHEKIGRPEYTPGDTLPKYAQRNVVNPKELDDIIEKGFMLPKEGSTKGKYFTMTDEVLPSTANRQKPVLRVPSSKMSFDRAVRASDVEIWHNPTEQWMPLPMYKKYAKGGMIERTTRDRKIL